MSEMKTTNVVAALRKHGLDPGQIPLTGIWQNGYEVIGKSGVTFPYPSNQAAEEIFLAWREDVRLYNEPEAEQTHTEVEARWLEWAGDQMQRYTASQREMWIAGWQDGRRG